MFEDLQTAHHVAPHALKGVFELAVARMGRGLGLQLPRLKGLVAGGRVDAINPAIAGLIRGNGSTAPMVGRCSRIGSTASATG